MNERLFPLSMENNLGFKVQDARFFSTSSLITLRGTVRNLIEFINLFHFTCLYMYGEEERKG